MARLDCSMRAVIQRVSSAQVSVDGRLISQINQGLLVLLGVEQSDTVDDAISLATKTIGLRIFDDAQGKMNLSLNEINGQLLVVSQFTLLGDARKGRRPSFIKAAEPEQGKRLYEMFVSSARQQGTDVHTGQFRAQMQVQLVNDGPVTILLDSGKLF